MGCYSHTKLPNLTKSCISHFPIYLIINTSCRKRGGHWISLFLKNKNEAYHFDSFGKGVKKENIKYFLILNGYSSIMYNNVNIQDISSKTCGLFCIQFVKHVKSKTSYLKFLKLFDTSNLKKNDLIVKLMLELNKC